MLRVSLCLAIVVLLLAPKAVARGFETTHFVSNNTFITASYPQPTLEQDISLFADGGLLYPEQAIQNGDFESNLDNWQSTGEVKVMRLENEHYAYDSGMVRLGWPEENPYFPGDFIDTHAIEQTFELDSRTPHALSFFFNVATYEHLKAFDDPAFVVFINNKMVYQHSAYEVFKNASNDSLEMTGWQRMIIPLPEDETDFTVRFQAGNTGDELRQSFVYLDRIETIPTVIDTSNFELITKDPTDWAWYTYQFQGRGVRDKAEHSISFSIETDTGIPDNNILEFWRRSADGARFPRQSVIVMSSEYSVPIAPAELELTWLADNYLGASWVAPHSADSQFGYNHAFLYQAKVSTEPLTPENWHVADEVQVINPTVFLSAGLLSPTKQGEREFYQVILPPIYTDEVPFYFGLRTIDRTQTFSSVTHYLVSP